MDKKKIIPIAIVMAVFVVFSVNAFVDKGYMKVTPTKQRVTEPQVEEYKAGIWDRFLRFLSFKTLSVSVPDVEKGENLNIDGEFSVSDYVGYGPWKRVIILDASDGDEHICYDKYWKDELSPDDSFSYEQTISTTDLDFFEVGHDYEVRIGVYQKGLTPSSWYDYDNDWFDVVEETTTTTTSSTVYTTSSTVYTTSSTVYTTSSTVYTTSSTTSTTTTTTTTIPWCVSDRDCSWCGQKCYAKWNMPDTCPYIAPPKGYKCACNRITGECEKKMIDADDDGVPDYKDDCPKISADTPNGCPYNDQDADGVYDRNDACSNEAGSGPRGCPNFLEKFVHLIGFKRWTM